MRTRFSRRTITSSWKRRAASFGRPPSAERPLRPTVQHSLRPLRHVFAERYSVRVIESEDYLYDACAYVRRTPSRPACATHPRSGRGPTAAQRPAGGPAFLREEEAVPSAVGAAEPDQERDARERAPASNAAVLEHTRPPVVDGVARAGGPRRATAHGEACPVEFTRTRGSGLSPERMSQRSAAGPTPVMYPQAMLPDGMRNVS